MISTGKWTGLIPVLLFVFLLGSIPSFAAAGQKIIDYQKDKYVLVMNEPTLESCVVSLVDANAESKTLHVYPSGPFLSPVGRVRIDGDLLFVELNGTEVRTLDIYDLRTGARVQAKYGQYYISRDSRYVFSFDNDQEVSSGLCLEYYRGKYVGLALQEGGVAGRLTFRRNRKAREFLSYNGATGRKTIDLTELVKEKGL